MSKVWIKWEAFEWLRNLLSAIGFRPVYLPWVGAVPAPTEILAVWVRIVGDPSYWQSWYMSFSRVTLGFLAAMIVGIPFGLLLAVSRIAYGISFPVFEMLRPIPPLAWVPAAIIFWPTQELSIAFVTFIGAFYTIVINVIGGARSMCVFFKRHGQWDPANGIFFGALFYLAHCLLSWWARWSAWELPGRSWLPLK